MPTSSLPYAPHYVQPPQTKENLEYAELAVIDLAKASTLEGRAELAKQVRDAMHSHGFFYAINHGYTPAQTERIFDIADIPFSAVEDEQKKTYHGNIKETGSYQGYKLRQYWHIDNGVRDQVEHYNTHRNVTNKEHPDALRPFLPELEAFAVHNHYNILHPVLRLLAIGLELPEETFVECHGFHAKGESSTRFMKYYPRSEAEEVTTKSVWLKGHIDIGSITILWNQPVSGLQILSHDGQWRWIRYLKNAVTINAGDAMEYLSGGYYKGTIHRVIQPAADQRDIPRLGAFYFAMADDDVRLVPRATSTLLQQHGIKLPFQESDAPTMETWRKGRVSAYGQTQLKKGQEAGVEEEVVSGVVVKHYN